MERIEALALPLRKSRGFKCKKCIAKTYTELVPEGI
jgi:hypothetical protein